jgi:riboflavin synthase
MFTGLIEKTGKLIAIKESDKSASLTIECGEWNDPLKDGESVAVQGACLTVTSSSKNTFDADLLKETIGKTTFVSMKQGTVVNLERALRSDDRLGGHIVSGHVDGLGTVKSVSQIGRDWILDIACESGLLQEIIVKGSIAINGVSLTVTECTDASFAVNIIPHTWANTNLNGLKAGDILNVETDVIAKYVNKYQERTTPSEVTLETLKNAGFI